ncbi:MAG: TraB family protein [Methanomicrobiales archaeon HGW-Methanomicrobiales-3]|jgi:pheromone shutdown-related protein TraB|nr:MAG: TraB family protein [Methanomicrobiales archaeon HGW-Methanomicrobiales-3]
MAEIKIIGTAHVSQASVDEVRNAIEEYHPDVVAIELDPSRFAALKRQAADPSVKDVLEVKNFNTLLVQWLLAYLQRKIGLDVGVEPGAEMKVAIEEAEKRTIPIALVDRDIRITLLRFWNSLGFFGKIKMGWALVLSIAEVDNGQEIDIESLKDQDVIDMVMEEFRKFSPSGAHALIDERDAYIAHQLVLLKAQRPEGKILAVVGAGHRQGIDGYLANPKTLPPFNTLTAEPRSFPWGKIFGFAVTGLFAFLLAAIWFSGVGFGVLFEAFIFWVVIHGVLSGLFVLLAGGHPYSALACFCVAWMTSLNPMLQAGWVGAYVEARVRQPPLTDFRKIYETESLTEMAKVPLFKVVLVAALGNLGSILGTVLYFIFLFPLLGIDPAQVISQGVQNMAAWISGLI